MGIDIEVWVEAVQGWSEKWLYDEPFSPIDERNAYYAPDGATHHCSSTYRLYDIGYERGYWPDYAARILELFEDRGVMRIWYGGDSSDNQQEMTLPRFVGLCLLWASCGQDYYVISSREKRSRPSDDMLHSPLRSSTQEQGEAK